MKRIILWMLMMALLLLVGCKKGGSSVVADPTAIPTIQPTIAEPTGIAPKEEATPTPAVQKAASIADYFPVEADAQYQYGGEGNEYAPYIGYVDYIDNEKSKFQIRIQNGGTETVRVLELQKDKLVVTYKANECYYRENFLDRKGEEEEILLMEPLEVGNRWELFDGRIRYISGLSIPVDTPYGSFEALEVTTEEGSAVVKDYYAAGIGPIKSIYESDTTVSNPMIVTSFLSAINRNTPFNQAIQLFYPGVDEKMYSIQQSIPFKTGENAKDKLQELLRKRPDKKYLPLMSADTKINKLSISEEGTLLADFSKQLVDGMNLGSGYELLVLQGLTNTLGTYYGVTKVYITIDGKPYESGHVLMREGEVFNVDITGVKYVLE